LFALLLLFVLLVLEVSFFLQLKAIATQIQVAMSNDFFILKFGYWVIRISTIFLHPQF